MTSSLVPKQITDKNGVTKKHWVAPETAPTSTTSMPRPARVPSPKAEAKRIGAEIRQTRRTTDHTGWSNSWSANDGSHLQALIDDANVDALRIIQRLYPLDTPYGPGHIGIVTQKLRESDMDPIKLVTVESLDAREKIIKAITAYGRGFGNPYLYEREGSLDVYLMAFTDTESVDDIAEIVRARGIMPPEQIRALVKEMQNGVVSLREGIL